MNRCVGCGAQLQNGDPNGRGYVTNLDSPLCLRCFKIKNYGDYIPLIKEEKEFNQMLTEISKTGDLVVIVCDLFNFNPDFSILEKYIKNDVLLVLTKRDLLPKSLYEDKILSYISDTKLNIVDRLIISSTKNYNFDLLIELINKYKKSKDVYVIGYTNAGKSTMINKLIYNYTESSDAITTSILPNTTVDNIRINISDDLNIIDTPGILDDGSIYYLKTAKELKNIIPKGAVDPKVYQINKKQSIMVDDLFKLDLKNNNIVVFISNRLKIKRIYNDIDVDMDVHNISVKAYEDVVISGIGFIKFTKDENITLYTLKGIKVYKRKSLI